MSVTTPNDLKSKFAGAIAGALAAVAIGGAGLALAQEAPTTTEPPAAETPATPDDGGDRPGREGCDKDGDGVDDRAEDAPAADQTAL